MCVSAEEWKAQAISWPLILAYVTVLRRFKIKITLLKTVHEGPIVEKCRVGAFFRPFDVVSALRRASFERLDHDAGVGDRFHMNASQPAFFAALVYKLVVCMDFKPPSFEGLRKRSLRECYVSENPVYVSVCERM